jgi:hypothetical protein
VKTAAIDISGRGRRYGDDLVEQYRINKRVTCRCRCTRLVSFSAEELATGAATSCGCSAPSLARVNQLKRLGAELRRAINFSIAKAR